MKLHKYSEKEILSRLDSEAPADALWIFDCDGTLVTGDVASHTAWGLIRAGIAARDQLPDDFETRFRRDPFDFEAFDLLRTFIASRGGNSVYEWEALLQSGHTPEAIHKVAKEIIDIGLGLHTLQWTEPVSTIARRHADRAWIVSGSPQVCVQVIGEKLNIPKERTLASLLEVKDGLYPRNFLPPGIVWEGLKRLILEEKGIYRPWFVAGDSIGDWAMMEMAVGWRWCILWGEHRHRGVEMRGIVQERVLKDAALLPEEPGIYVFSDEGKNWILEVKSKPERPDRVTK